MVGPSPASLETGRGAGADSRPWVGGCTRKLVNPGVTSHLLKISHRRIDHYVKVRARKASAAHDDVRDDLRAFQNTPLLQTKLRTHLFLAALRI